MLMNGQCWLELKSVSNQIVISTTWYYFPSDTITTHSPFKASELFVTILLHFQWVEIFQDFVVEPSWFTA